MQSVLKLLRTYYPQSFKDMDREGSEILLNVWTKAMEAEDPALVKRAVWEIINTETREFAPNIAQVRKKMLSLSGIIEGKGILSVDEAWDTVRTFWSSISTDNPWEIEKDWSKLPAEIKRIYKPTDIVELAFRTSSSQIEQYEKPRFYKLYESVSAERKTEVLRTTSITQLAIETAKENKQITGGGDTDAKLRLPQR